MIQALLIASLLSSPSVPTFNADTPGRYVKADNGVVYWRVPIRAGATGQGVTAPNWVLCGTTASGLEMNGTDELYIVHSIRNCWDGTNPILMVLFFGPNAAGDPFAAGETVTPTFTWRAAAESESNSDGTAEVDTDTYTQSGTGANCAAETITLILSTALPQQYTYGDSISGVLTFTDTYSGTPLFAGGFIMVPVKQLCLAD